MTKMLASVRNIIEARQVVAANADIVDLKEPNHGALGALSIDQIRTIVAQLGNIKPLSATIGDLPMEPGRILNAVIAMSGMGVTYIKIGFFPNGDREATLTALQPLVRLKKLRLVAVLFADKQLDVSTLHAIAKTGFVGAMIDTADKSAGSLLDLVTPKNLAKFIHTARSLGLLTGLAGSLKLSDIPILLPLDADYLGFRGALCNQRDRTETLDLGAIKTIRSAIPQSIERILVARQEAVTF